MLVQTLVVVVVVVKKGVAAWRRLGWRRLAFMFELQRQLTAESNTPLKFDSNDLIGLETSYHIQLVG